MLSRSMQLRAQVLSFWRRVAQALSAESAPAASAHSESQSHFNITKHSTMVKVGSIHSLIVLIIPV